MTATGPRILVVDDQPESIRLLHAVLSPRGYSVDSVSSGAEALERLAAEPAPDLVLLDWELPGLQATDPSTLSTGSGQSLLSALHSLGCHLKVIALSGHVEAREEALAAGADAFVSKGDPPERLLTALRTVGVASKI